MHILSFGDLMTHFIFSPKRSRVTKALCFKLQISHYRNVLCTAAFRLSCSGKKKQLSYHVQLMAYLACLSERHLANKMASLSAILNNIKATYAVQLLSNKECQCSQFPLNKIISTPIFSIKSSTLLS